MDDNNMILEAKGVGLGLSTARALVLSLGGKIEIGTNEGEGTKVLFSMVVENKPTNKIVTLRDFSQEAEEIIHDLSKDNLRLAYFNGNLMQHKTDIVQQLVLSCKLFQPE